MGSLYDSLPRLRSEDFEVNGFTFRVRGMSMPERFNLADLMEEDRGKAIAYACLHCVTDPESGEKVFGRSEEVEAIDSEIAMALASKVMEMSGMGKGESSE